MASVTFGRFEIQRELGRGAMGIVYEAHDPERGVDVALKVMTVPAHYTAEQRKRQAERFAREAHALSELCHPNVVRVFDDGEIGGRQFFSMELVRGTNLRDRLQFQGPLSVPEIIRMATELCDALEHIHGRGIVHRDVKPDNIMLLPDGRAKLMDFGIAQFQFDDRSRAGGGFQGSPAYMSPEQVAGRPIDGRSDIYSLGITLYEAATGRRAVEGDSIPVITQKVANEYPPPPVGLPPYLQGILLKALSKEPEQRYQYPAEMAHDIRAARMPSTQHVPAAAGAPLPLAYLGAAEAGGPGLPPSPPAGPARYGPGGAGAAPPGGGAPTSGPADGLSQDWLLPGTPPTAPAAGTREVTMVAARVACGIHPHLTGVAACSACGRPVCYTCLLDVPNRGIICRGCAFGKRS